MNTDQIVKGFKFTATNGITYTVIGRYFYDADGIDLGYIQIVFTDGIKIHKADLNDFFEAAA